MVPPPSTTYLTSLCHPTALRSFSPCTASVARVPPSETTFRCSPDPPRGQTPPMTSEKNDNLYKPSATLVSNMLILTFTSDISPMDSRPPYSDIVIRPLLLIGPNASRLSPREMNISFTGRLNTLRYDAGVRIRLTNLTSCLLSATTSSTSNLRFRIFTMFSTWGLLFPQMSL